MAEKKIPKNSKKYSLNDSPEANLEFEFERMKDILIIKLSGEADLLGSSKLRQHLVRKLDGVHRVIFDLSGLKFADSYFLRLLIKLRKRLGGVSSVEVRNMKPNIRKIFEITGLDKLFIQGE